MGNDFRSNREGIAVHSHSNYILLNNIIDNNYGIGLYTDNSLIVGNNISKNDYGIKSKNSIANSIKGNNFTLNRYYGISLSKQCRDNYIYRNNFIDNENQVKDDGYKNFWKIYYSYKDDYWNYVSFSKYGNYWSDYNGSDQFRGESQDISGSDGIGDTPYFIGAESKDEYPLIEPFILPDIFTPLNLEARASYDNITIINYQVPVMCGLISSINIYRSTKPGEKEFYGYGQIQGFFKEYEKTENITYYYRVSVTYKFLGEGPLSEEISGTFGDFDNDGILDEWELKYDLNPEDYSDSIIDTDTDGLTNLEEYLNGTDPTNPDTDGDGYNDGEEVISDNDPLNENDYPGKDKKSMGPKTFRQLIVILIIVIVILVWSAIFFKIRRKRREDAD
jgi:parallel beta-helix repeat protein